MKRGWAIALTLTLSAPALAGTLRGDVHDKRSGRIPSGALVTVVGTDFHGRIAPDGTFSINGIPAGRYRIKIEAPGYLPLLVSAVPIRDDRPVQLHASLKAGVLQSEASTIEADRPSQLARTETSVHTFTAADVKKTAGARNDPILAVTNAAGVHTAGFGPPTIRGGGPEDNQYFLDGYEIGNPFHFGGLVSIFNADTISKVDLYTGALPSRYGNVKSAVIDVETRPPRTDRVHGVANVNLLYSEGLLEGPLWSGAGFSLAGRRSYIDLLIGKFLPTFTVFPVFDDYQGRASQALPGGGRLDLSAFGSEDALALVMSGGKTGRGIGSISTISGFSSSGIQWRQPFGEKVSNRLTLNYQEPHQDTQVGTFLSILDHRYQSTVGDDLVTQLNDYHQLRTGLRYDTINLVERQTIPIPPKGTSFRNVTPDDVATWPTKSTDYLGNQKVYGAYLEDAWKASDPLTLSLGARYDGLQSTGENHVSPRLGATWRMDPDTTWRLAYGQQFQFPSENQLLPGLGNPDLMAPFSRDYVAGFDRQIADRLLSRFEVYHRDLLFLVVPDKASKYLNNSSGRSEGAEWTLEMAETRGWSGSLALTYSRTFNTTPADGEIPYQYDQPWLANLLLSAPKLGDWTPSLKLRYSSGLPNTPVIGRTQNKDGSYSPVNGATNSARFPDGITWSARVERPAPLWGLNGTFYLELTQQHEVFGADYGTNYENYNNPTFNYGLPAIPYLGYEARF
jgi:hypothetical protein